MSARDSSQLRAAFAQRIAQEAGITTAGLVHGLAAVPREDFVGAGPWKLMRPGQIERGYELTPDDDPRHLYDKVLVALDPARSLNNGEPSSLLSWLDSLKLAAGDRFLHVGCGVGYYTAIAALALEPGGSVLGVEIDEQLAAQAQRNLRPYAHVSVACGNGIPNGTGPFDAIFVNAGCTDPQAAWLEALNVNGRLLLPLTVSLPMPGIGGGLMLLVTRHDTGYDARFTTAVGIFHCVGGRTDDGNERLRRSLMGGKHASVRRLRRDQHAQSDDCWLHGADYCLSMS